MSNEITNPVWEVLGDRSVGVLFFSGPLFGHRKNVRVSAMLLLNGEESLSSIQGGEFLVPSSLKCTLHFCIASYMSHTVEQLTRSEVFPESVGMKCKDFLFRAAVHFISSFPLISAISYCKAEEGKPTEIQRDMCPPLVCPPFCVCK